MSIPVSLGELPGQVERFGSTPYLVTVGQDSTPHAASVTVVWQENLLMAGAGRLTAGNIEKNDQVALLWPADRPGGHALIVDGWADVRSLPHGLFVMIQPSRAVLHITSRGLG
ncbi:MAG: pyridoxamine 5'-phosphate oxidase family protein [Actinomycetota bacterium]